MKKLKDMTLEELLEFEKKHYVLSKNKFGDRVCIPNFMSTFLMVDFIPLMILDIYNMDLNMIHLIIDLGIYIPSFSILATNLIHNQLFFKLSDYQKYRKSLPINQELIRLYNQVCNDLLIEIDEHPFEKDPLTLSILVGDYLIPDGILSYTSKFHRITADNSNELINCLEPSSKIYPHTLEGMYIIAGYGVCRHYNSFISDLLTKKGVMNDKVLCICDELEIVKERIKENNFVINHLITGYLENNCYYLIDSFNHNYTIIKECDFYAIPNETNVIIPDFRDTSHSKETHYHLNIPYETIPEVVVREKRQKIENLLQQPNIKESFIKFKQEHFEIYEKIAYLTPLELERTEEKEKQKLKTR